MNGIFKEAGTSPLEWLHGIHGGFIDDFDSVDAEPLENHRNIIQTRINAL